MNALEAPIIAAHASGDGATLAKLYERAADHAFQANMSDAGCFFLTHAYVWALDAGDPAGPRLKRRLIALGRETEI